MLAIADGAGTSGAARLVGVSRPTVIKWRDRFAARRARRAWTTSRAAGRPKTIDDAQIIAATLEPPPAVAGGHALVLAAAGQAPGDRGRDGRAGVARLSRAAVAARDVQVLHRPRAGGQGPRRRRPVSEPAGATRSCSASTRSPRSRRSTAPSRSCRCGPGLPEKATHDYKRNGTTTLFAALEVATGTVTDRCYDRHGKAEFLDFLKHVAKAYPRRKLHVVLDNYHTHKHDDINHWLAKNPRITLHFTPTSGSWLNLVEVFFGIITRQAIRRGSFDSVKELVTAIRAFIDGYNDRCHPFIWTKTADEILPRATRQTNFRRGTLGQLPGRDLKLAGEDLPDPLARALEWHRRVAQEHPQAEPVDERHGQVGRLPRIDAGELARRDALRDRRRDPAAVARVHLRGDRAQARVARGPEPQLGPELPLAAPRVRRGQRLLDHVGEPTRGRAVRRADSSLSAVARSRTAAATSKA